MEKLIKLSFNPKPSTIMHIDINSCFATIEQQANPYLRGKPVAVAAYNSPKGCILAASVDAKKLGVKTGMRVCDGKLLCKNLIVLEPDPQKYRDVHIKLNGLLKNYSHDVVPKSIDEFVINFEGYPAFFRGLFNVSAEIKMRIKKEIGDYITVSIGLAPNRFLAKTASNLKKPDGLSEINKDNHLEIFSKLALMDLCGIKRGNASRLGSCGIFTLLDFYNSSPEYLVKAFRSVCGYHWYLRLHGWEIDDVDFGRKSFGNSFALPKPPSTVEELSPILTKLVEKTGQRLRKSGYRARGIHVAINYRDGTHWHQGKTLEKEIFDSRDIYREVFRILCKSPYKKPVSILAESVYNLVDGNFKQSELFDDIDKKYNLVQALDIINEKWGDYVITPARMLYTQEYVHDRIAFGR